MDIYLPLAKMAVNGPFLLLIGALGGFMSGLFGIGGAFVVTPILLFIGVPPSLAVGTQAAQLSGTGMTGAILYAHKKQIDIRMGLILVIGSMVGVSCGVLLFRWLKRVGHIDDTIVIGYIALLLFIGLLMLRESLRLLRRPVAAAPVLPARLRRKPWGANWPFRMLFPASRLRLSILAPLLIGFVTGILAALLGVGGGFLLIPAMLYLLRMPAKTVNGTTVFQMVFTTAYSAFLQSIMNHDVDVVLAALLLLGSVLGVQYGSYAAGRVRHERARLMLAILILGVALQMILKLTLTPHSLFSIETDSLI